MTPGQRPPPAGEKKVEVEKKDSSEVHGWPKRDAGPHLYVVAGKHEDHEGGL